MRSLRIALLTTAALALTAATAAGRSPIVRAGAARFEVLTPTLIRMEYAADGAFQNAPTQTAVRARLHAPRYHTRISHGTLTITTTRLRLRYVIGRGPLGPGDLTASIHLDGRRVTFHPSPGSGPGNLGGWTRALDNQAGPVPLHDGILATSGWYVLDDTHTVLLTGSGFSTRPTHRGSYQDLYLFAYGHNYRTGLKDLRLLTGPAPLPPRTAFGVWFSRYWPYSESDYHALLDQFRAHQVPLDTLSVDTDFKREANAAGAAAAAVIAGAPGRPYAWNGWEWNPTLFPDPQRFIDWAHGQGLSLAINIHPSIDSTDPRYAPTVAQYGPLSPASGQCMLLQADPLGTCHTFDWTDARQLAAYFALHRPFTEQGIDMFWLDWCCENVQPATPGLTPDTWINLRYAAEQRARGSRWPAFSRIGGAYAPDGQDGDRTLLNGGAGALAEHRYSLQFTGDTCATWPMLAFESQLSAGEGNIGLPYVSHDIGAYNGPPGKLGCGSADTLGPAAAASHHDPDDLYARWVQLGTFQPLDRLHSNHGDRLPWQYGAAADAAATTFLRLREALIPYTYTLARRAYDTGLPLTRALYLQWPRQAAAYQHPAEYTFGPDIVVSPVTSPGDPATTTLWVPPGSWYDYFTGQRLTGPRTIALSVPLSRMPVLVRAGTVLTTQAAGPDTPPGPNPALTLTVYPGARGSFALYDDAGLGFGYQHRAYTWTRLGHLTRGRRSTITIGAARGSFPGAPARRTWTVHLVGIARPRNLTVAGRAHAFTYDPASRTATVAVGPAGTSHRVTIVARV